MQEFGSGPCLKSIFGEKPRLLMIPPAASLNTGKNQGKKLRIEQPWKSNPIAIFKLGTKPLNLFPVRNEAVPPQLDHGQPNRGDII
jgi:hypothetical protein